MKRMSERLISLLCAFLMFFSFHVMAHEQQISVTIDGEYLNFEVYPQAISGRTMVPMRAIFEYLGAEVNWIPETNGISATKDDTKIQMQLNNNDMYINSEKITLDVCPVAVNSRTLVPVRAVSEALDAYVGWDGTTSTVIILTNKSDIPKKAQGVWRYLYLEKDGMVIPKEEATGMDIFKKDFTITINGTDAHLSADGYSATGHLECNDGVYTVLGMVPSFEANTMKLYNEKQNTSVVLIKTNMEPKPEQVKKLNEEKDWVYTAATFEDYYEDSVGNSCHYKYTVPAFNIASADAQRINSEIYSDIYNQYLNTLEMQNGKFSLMVYEISCVYYINNDIVSLGIETSTDWGDTGSRWYNINKSTGKSISNSELVASLGYTEEQFVSHLKNLAADFYVNLWKNNNPMGQNDFYLDRYNYTISDEACNINVPLYVGENGNLWAIANIGSLAGASHYEYAIDTGIKVSDTAPTFTLGRALECIELWEKANASLSHMYPLFDNDTVEVVVSEENSYIEIAKRVMGPQTREDVKKDILECVTVAAEQKYEVTDTAFEMGGVESDGKLYAYMPGYGPAFYLADTAKITEDINGYKCVSISEGHNPDDTYVFCFAIENGRWKIAEVIENIK